MRLPYELHLALRYLRVHRGRTFLSVITLISVGGVTVGAAALVIALALMTGFQDDVRERILAGSAHLTVMSGASATFDRVDEVLERSEAVPGVEAAGPVLFSHGMAAAEGGGAAYVELMGIDPARHGKVLAFAGADEALAPLATDAPGGRDPVVLGENLAASLGVGRGDTVRILVPRVTLSPFAPIPKSRVFEVVGTFRTEHYPEDVQRAYVPLEPARQLLGESGRASWIEIRLSDVRRLEEVKPALRDALSRGWLVVDMLEQNQKILKALNTERLILFLAIGLIVVVASLNIVSTLILMVQDKIREIGALTAMGARPAGIALVFMAQGLVIGVIGGAVGLVVGVVSATLLDAKQAIRLDPGVYYLDHVPFSVRGQDLVFVALLVLAISLVATIYPAWKAASQDPVEALRHE